MKKITIVLFFLLSLCVPACAVNFVEVELGMDGDALTYIDVDSIELRKTNNHEYVVAWFKMTARGDEGEDIDCYRVLYAFNKKARQGQSLSTHVYDKKGNLIDSGERSFQTSRYLDAIPDTSGGIIYDFVMSYCDQNKIKERH